MKGFFGKTILFACLFVMGVALSCAYADGGSTVQLVGGIGCAFVLVATPSVDLSPVIDYFERYPHSEECYENGGILFHDRGSADSYGKTETEKYTRTSLLDNKTSSVLPPIAEVDIESLSYEQLKEYVKVLEIEVSGQSKKAHLDALQAYKDNLKTEE